MATSNPNAGVPPVPTGVGAAANTFPFLNVTGSISALSLTTTKPLQIQNGSHLYSGFGAPSNASGVNGDFYFRRDGSTSTHIYFKASGSWSGLI